MVLSGVISINDAFADHSEVTITTVDESGFSLDCIESGCYTPVSATVEVGGVVTMTNTDTTGVHTFTSGTVDGFTPSPDAVFDSGVLMSGDLFTWTAETEGEQPYYCMLHTWMTGLIVVQEAVTEEHEDEEHTGEEGLSVNVIQGEVIPGQGKSINIKVINAVGTVEIEIIEPDGDLIDILAFPASGNGEVGQSWIIPKDSAPGTYTVKVKDIQNTAQTTFKIDEPYTPPITQIPLVVDVLSENVSLDRQLSFRVTSILENNIYFLKYDVDVIQNGQIIFQDNIRYEEYCTPSCSGKYFKTPHLSDISPITIRVTFQGWQNSQSEWLGPIGETIELEVIPVEQPSTVYSKITITAASGSSSPGCETTSQGCYLPKIATVEVGGVVTMTNTDTTGVVHTFTSGTVDGFTPSPDGVFDSSILMSGDSFTWTAETEGEQPYYCMLHTWMVGTIFVGEGTYIPPTEDDFDLQIIMGNQVYDLLDTVTMNLSINGISTPQNVALEISDPRGTTVISRSFEVDSQGVPFEFRIDENFKTGTYKVVATTSNNGNTVTDTAYFKVKSQYNSFKITSVQVTDQQGNPSNLQAGEMGFIKVNLEANKSITTLVTVNLFDSELTSIGIGSIKTTLSSGNSEIILSFMIPSDVAVGSSDIYVNAFSDWPSNGGIPLTSEISITENIE